MKDNRIILIFMAWLSVITVIFGVFLDFHGNRITELEEKAKHFRCLEKRIERFKPVRIKDNTGGGWYIVVDSLDLETRCSPLNND